MEDEDRKIECCQEEKEEWGAGGVLGCWIKEMDAVVARKMGRWDNCETNKDRGSPWGRALS